jgi:hypothetical protein
MNVNRLEDKVAVSTDAVSVFSGASGRLGKNGGKTVTLYATYLRK